MAETIDIRELNERIERQSAFVTNLTTGMDQVIVGQKHLVESLLIGLLSDGHVLLEGVPGLAKTLAIKTLASLIDAQYSRIQFTPDLLPADVIGTMVYSQKDETFQVVGLTRHSCNSALSVRYSFSACSMGRPRVLPTLGRRRSKSTSNAVLVVW